MFEVNQETKLISMIENDFGEILPIRFTSGKILETDIIKFIIYDKNETKLLNKPFNVVDNILNFQLTKEETLKIPKGNYFYSVKQFRGEELIDTLQMDNDFIVKKGIKEE